MKSLTLTVVMLCIAALGGCKAGVESVPGPHVVAIGGGLESSNERVLSACVSRQSEGVIVIIPWASGDQAAASASAAKMFTAHAPRATIVAAPDPKTDLRGAILAVQRARAAGDLLYMTGGDQSRIMARLLDPSMSELLAAFRAAAGSPGVIVAGTSAGAAVMSDPMFTGGRSDAALSATPLQTATKGDDEDNPGDEPKAGPRLAPGLGLLSGVLVDTHFAQRGRLGRLIAALEASGKSVGFGINENRAIASDGMNLEFLGGEDVTIKADITTMRRDGDDRLGVRIGLLSEGSQGRQAAPAGQARAVAIAVKTPLKAARSPWAKNEVVYMIRRLATDPGTPQVTRGEHFELTLRADARTSFSPVTDASGAVITVTATDVIADVRRVK